MKRTALLAAAAAALLTSATAEARVPAPPARLGGPPDVPADCPLTVAFLSFGTGIDGATFERIGQRLRTDRRVVEVTRHRWGREGEVTLCVRLRRTVYVPRVAEQLRRMIPRRPQGWTEVRLHARRAF